MSRYPKILFVTPQAFNHFTGTGITFSNLFCGWPKDCLATVHNDAEPTADDVCERFFVLGAQEIDLFAPLRPVRTVAKRRVKECGGEARAVASPLLGSIVARVQGDSAPQRVRLTAALERFITEFRPDLLHSVLGTNAFMALTIAIRRRFRLPTVIHLMDDFPAASHRRGLFAPFERMRMQRLLADNFRTATACMGICREMCEAFAQRYGRSFVAFQNCVDVARLRAVVRTDAAAKGPPYRLLYFGSVFANAQLASLADICRSVARLNDGGFAVGFDIAAPGAHRAQHRAALPMHPAIRLIPQTEDDRAFFEMLAAADALVLPVNFDAKTVEFIRYSMPTKVPAYLASGTPILVHGPAGVAQVDYAAREGWGVVVNDRAPQALDAALRRILCDEALREKLHRRAQAVAREHHDTARVRAMFQDALKHAARAGGSDELAFRGS
jgi:glycosyltransferase involved in cell wall biosynthesis